MNTRRQFLRTLGLSTAFLNAPGAFAAALQQTPKVGFGPFYPDHLPLDTDNDLILINDGITPAVGEISYVTGRVLGPDGEPIRNAVVEIWQADKLFIPLPAYQPLNRPRPAQHPRRTGGMKTSLAIQCHVRPSHTISHK